MDSLMSHTAPSPVPAALGKDGVGAMGVPWGPVCGLGSLLREQAPLQAAVHPRCPVPCPGGATGLRAARRAPLGPAQTPSPSGPVSPACLAAANGPESRVLAGAWRSPHAECRFRGTVPHALSNPSRRARLGDPSLPPPPCSPSSGMSRRGRFGGVRSSRCCRRGPAPSRPAHPRRPAGWGGGHGGAGAGRGGPRAVGWRGRIKARCHRQPRERRRDAGAAVGVLAGGCAAGGGAQPAPAPPALPR